jgi:hypothetical protein
MSLTGPAANRCSSYGIESTVFQEANTFQDYAVKLFEVFEPDSEKMLAKCDFRSYKQESGEDIGAYISTKVELFLSAFPGTEMDTDPTAFETYRSELIRGIYSPIIRRRITRSSTATEEALKMACLEAVSAEREAYSLGCSEAPNLDGLSSVSRGYQRRRQPEEGTAVPMEVNAMKNLTCHFCQKVGHLQKDCRKRKSQTENKPKIEEGRNRNQPNKNKTGKEERACHHCGKKGHLQKDCWSKNNRPAKTRINQVEDKEEETKWDFFTEDQQINAMSPVSFLGKTGRRYAN